MQQPKMLLTLQERMSLTEKGLFESVMGFVEEKKRKEVIHEMTFTSKFEWTQYMTSCFPPKLLDGESCEITTSDGVHFCGVFSDPNLEELREFLGFVIERSQPLFERYRKTLVQKELTICHEVRQLLGHVEIMYVDLQNRGVMQVQSNPNYTSASFREENEKVDDVYNKIMHNNPWDYFSASMCAAGTLYRHLLVPISDGRLSRYGKRGQTSGNQLNGLIDVQSLLASSAPGAGELWKTSGNELILNNEKCDHIQHALELSGDERITSLVRVGTQENTEYSKIEGVDKGGATQVFTFVPQIKSSRDTEHHEELEEKLTRILINAAYEAAFLVGATRWAKSFYSYFTHRQEEAEQSEVKFEPPILVLTDVTKGIQNPKRIKWIQDALDRASEAISGKYHIPLKVIFFHPIINEELAQEPKKYKCD